MIWALQDAKNQLSKVVRRAIAEGPQTLTVRGERAAVVLSAREYDRLKGSSPNFVDDLLAGPEWDDEFVDTVNARSKEPPRDIDL